MTSLASTAGERQELTPQQQKSVAALARYAELYGPDFTTAAFSPSTAKWRDDLVSVERYYAGDPETGLPWPSLNKIKGDFGGSFNAARRAAGLPANRPGPSKARRAAGMHRPRREISHVGATRRIVEVREKLVEDRRVPGLERRAKAAEKALGRAERLLERERERTAAARRTAQEQRGARVREQLARAREEATEARQAARAARTELAAAMKSIDAERADAARDRARLASQDAEVERLSGALTDERLALAEALERADRAEAALELADHETLAATQREVEQARALVAEAQAARSDAEHEALLARRERDAAVSRADRADRAATAAEARRREVEAAIAGTDRRLTAGELAELRRSGPGGPAVLAKALRDLASARAQGNGALPVALTEVAAAALRWKDRLR